MVEIEIKYLESLYSTINKHIEKFNAPNPYEPNLNDEVELLTILLGLSRLVEKQIKTCIELYTGNPVNPRKIYSKKLKDFYEKKGVRLLNREGFFLFDEIRKISNGLVHGNFAQVFQITKDFYSHTEWIKDLEKKSFKPLIAVETKLTEKGVIFNAQTLKVTDQNGNIIPSERLIPVEGKPITRNFLLYYYTGCYIFTFDILVLGLKRSLIIRKQIETGEISIPK